MSTTVVWTDSDKPGGLDEATFTDSFVLVRDGATVLSNHAVYERADGWTTHVITVKEPPRTGDRS